MTISLAFAIGMWTHVILNAMVTFRPTPAPREWLGELRLVWVVIATAAVWIALWWALDVPFTYDVAQPASSRVWA